MIGMLLFFLTYLLKNRECLHSISSHGIMHEQIVELKNAAQCASLILFVGEVVLVYWPSLVIVSFNHG